MRPDTAGDQVLVRAVLAGDRKAAEQLLHRIADGMWTACRLLTRDETDARDAFAGAVAAVQADGFRRLLPYDGRSRVETFVALITRDLLAQRVLRAFQEDPPRGWRVFESLFQADIRRLIFRRLPGPAHDDTRRDAYQEVCRGRGLSAAQGL